jgi:hypothetical protein
MVIVMTKKSFNLNFRIAPELDREFKNNAAKVGQTESNMIVLLMEAFNTTMSNEGHVIMPIQIKTPSDCVSVQPAIHTEHNGEGHQMIRVAESTARYHTSKKSKQR